MCGTMKSNADSLTSELTFKKHGRRELKEGIGRAWIWSAQEGMFCRQVYLWTLPTTSFNLSTAQVTKLTPQSRTWVQ